MQLKKIALIAALVAGAVPAFATISNGGSGNGELFLVVADKTAKVSYTLDLAIFQNDFVVNAQSDAGYSLNVAVNDAQWANFLTRVDSNNLAWAVLANEVTGGTAMGGQRTFTTVRVGQEALVATWTNQLFTNGTSTSTMGQFFSGISNTGTHGNVPSINGSSVVAESDPARGYFGEVPGTGPNFNNTSPFLNTNAVGDSSTFVYVTRSGINQLDTVVVDRFDNASKVGAWTFAKDSQGAYSLNYQLAAAVPEPSTYGLMLAGIAAVGFVARRRKAA